MTKRKRKRLMKPTLTDVLTASAPESKAMLDAMDLGELLALAGLKMEIECPGATPEFNAEVTKLMNQFRDDKKLQ